MKQIFYTVGGIWITIAAALSLTYLPGDVSPHDSPGSGPIIRKLNVAPNGERGAGIRLESTGFFTNESSVASEQTGLTIQRWWVECLPRDYRRTNKPRHENVSVYLSVGNGGDHTLTGLSVTIQFLNRTNYVVYEEIAEAFLEVPAGQSAERVLFWYAENNEFVTNGPYDIVSALVASGSLQLRVFIRDATFHDDKE